MEIKTALVKDAHGLGDMVAAATAALGVKPCGGCKKRAASLNAMLQFTPKPVWTKPPEVPEGWTQEASFEIQGRGLRLFHHENGQLIIWHVIEGRYERSHTFCCGDRMRAMAQEKWDELCRSL